MPRAVACPNCLVELDVPDNLLGQAVRCATCATVFTPAAAATGPSVGPRRSLDRGEPRDPSVDDDPSPRPRARASNRGVLAVALLFAGATLGVCCLGRVALLLIERRIDEPAFQRFVSPDGQFEAGFPGPPTATETPLTDAILLTGVTHTRSMGGQEIDTCSVQFYDLPKPPATDAARDAVLQATADAVVASQADLVQAALAKVTAQGYPALDLTMTGDDADVSLHARVVLAGRRVYVLSYDGHGLDPKSRRLRAFREQFKVLGPAAAGGKPADQPPEKAKGR